MSGSHSAHFNSLAPCRRATAAAAASSCAVPTPVWRPSEWEVSHYRPSLPRVTPAHIERACVGMRIHAAKPEWVQLLANRMSWEQPPVNKYARPRNATENRSLARERCVATLSSFRPRICSRRDVFVHGMWKMIFSPSDGTAVTHGPDPAHPSETRGGEWGNNVEKHRVRSMRPWECRSENGTAPGNASVFGPCGGHAVIGRNPMGVAYYHTVFETLGSLSYLLEFARQPDRHGGPVRVMDNLCIPAVGSQNKASMGGRVCPHGPSPGFVQGFFEWLGINGTQLQHYPWVRQLQGPPVFLDRVTFDCTQAPIRHFWHALKLRAELHSRFTTPPPQRDTLVLVDRNSCKGGAFCKKTRGVKRQKEIEEAVAARLQTMRGRRSGGGSAGGAGGSGGAGVSGAAATVELTVFRGEQWTIAGQAALFRRAVAMVGPHGAGEVNMLFMQPHTPVIEFVAVKPPPAASSNSALYAGYAHALGLPYWAVVSNATDGSYDAITPEDVADTVARALRGDNRPSALAEWDTFVTLGYGEPEGASMRDPYLHQGKVW